jgi:hypothetical protein
LQRVRDEHVDSFHFVISLLAQPKVCVKPTHL